MIRYKRGMLLNLNGWLLSGMKTEIVYTIDVTAENVDRVVPQSGSRCSAVGFALFSSRFFSLF